MATINIDDILSQTGTQIETLALQQLNNYKNQAIAAGQQILSDMKGNLQTWSQQLADGQITNDEFAVLVKTYQVNVAVVGLQQAGLAQVQAYDFGMNVLNIIINVVISTVQKLI